MKSYALSLKLWGFGGVREIIGLGFQEYPMFKSLQAKAKLRDTPAEQVSFRLFRIFPDHHYEIHQVNMWRML